MKTSLSNLLLMIALNLLSIGVIAFLVISVALPVAG